jgi:hypothetical protein
MLALYLLSLDSLQIVKIYPEIDMDLIEDIKLRISNRATKIDPAFIHHFRKQDISFVQKNYSVFDT